MSFEVDLTFVCLTYEFGPGEPKPDFPFLVPEVFGMKFGHGVPDRFTTRLDLYHQHVVGVGSPMKRESCGYIGFS